tara:strand:- start:520 stop:960 length:441 start_codon:yes stop_codon:yes gene_type:complete
MPTKQVTVYTIDEHPNPDAVIAWARDNWSHLGEKPITFVIDSLKALAKYIDGTLVFMLNKANNNIKYVWLHCFDASKLAELNAEDRPLTGYWSDIDVIRGLQSNTLERTIFKTVEECIDEIYSHTYLKNHCMANGHFFYTDGSCYK